MLTLVAPNSAVYELWTRGLQRVIDYWANKEGRAVYPIGDLKAFQPLPPNTPSRARWSGLASWTGGGAEKGSEVSNVPLDPLDTPSSSPSSSLSVSSSISSTGTVSSFPSGWGSGVSGPMRGSGGANGGFGAKRRTSWAPSAASGGGTSLENVDEIVEGDSTEDDEEHGQGQPDAALYRVACQLQQGSALFFWSGCVVDVVQEEKDYRDEA